MVKNPPVNAGDLAGFNPWVGKIPLEKERASSVFLPGKSHGQRSLVGYGPWVHRVRHGLTAKQQVIIQINCQTRETDTSH